MMAKRLESESRIACRSASVARCRVVVRRTFAITANAVDDKAGQEQADGDADSDIDDTETALISAVHR